MVTLYKSVIYIDIKDDSKSTEEFKNEKFKISCRNC